MTKKINTLKNKKVKGFTLVELIVVMVILAILAALLIPGLTKYIDKANEQSAIVEARNVAVAAQTITSEHYGKSKTDRTKAKMETYLATADTIKEILELSELETATLSKITVDANFKVKSFEYKNNGYTVTYDTAASELYTVVADAT